MEFTLVPFQPFPGVAKLTSTFTWSAARGDSGDGGISLRWELSGNVDTIKWPSPTSTPRRVTGLWESTCFECFIGSADGDDYLEFNLSPGGDWNAFEFSSLREGTGNGLTETLQLCCLGTELEFGKNGATLSAQLHCNRWTDRYWLGLSAVLEDVAGGRHYYALSHNTPRPDFHSRQNHVYPGAPS